MKITRKITELYNNAVDYLAYLAGILVVFIMLTIGAEVVVRKLLGFSIIWAVEYSEHAILYITFLSAAWLLRKKMHITIDVVLNYLNKIQTANSHCIFPVYTTKEASLKSRHWCICLK